MINEHWDSTRDMYEDDDAFFDCWQYEVNVQFYAKMRQE